MKIDIFDADFPRLQALATPFVDTPASIVSKLLDAFDESGARSTLVPLDTHIGEIFSLDSMPPLTHAKVMDGHFNGTKPARITWDGFVRQALIEVVRKTGSLDRLSGISGANIRHYHCDDQGYKFVPEHKFSFQGVSAEDAVKIIGRCARALNVPFSIEFVWRDKPNAHRPGARGIIKFL